MVDWFVLIEQKMSIDSYNFLSIFLSVRAAYLKAALKFHPDKAPVEDRETYTKKFQLIKKIYDLFQDKDLKKSYDETGMTRG